MFLGLFAFIAAAYAFPAILPGRVRELFAASLMLGLPAMIDVAAQRLGAYRSNATRRFLTSLLLGVSVVLACKVVTRMVCP